MDRRRRRRPLAVRLRPPAVRRRAGFRRSPIEVEPGCKLPLHTDSAEETIVVVAGTAEVRVGGESALLGAGDLAVVPEEAPHEVRNAGADGLRFIAVYAAADVVTRYAEQVQPDGSRERHTVGGG